MAICDILQKICIKSIDDLNPSAPSCSNRDELRLNRAQQIEVMQAHVERIGYDGVARRLSLRFRAVAGEGV